MGLERLSFYYRNGSNSKARGAGSSCQKGARFVAVSFSFRRTKGGRHGGETAVNEKGNLALPVSCFYQRRFVTKIRSQWPVKFMAPHVSL